MDDNSSPEVGINTIIPNQIQGESDINQDSLEVEFLNTQQDYISARDELALLNDFRNPSGNVTRLDKFAPIIDRLSTGLTLDELEAETAERTRILYGETIKKEYTYKARLAGSMHNQLGGDSVPYQYLLQTSQAMLKGEPVVETDPAVIVLKKRLNKGETLEEIIKECGDRAEGRAKIDNLLVACEYFLGAAKSSYPVDQASLDFVNAYIENGGKVEDLLRKVSHDRNSLIENFRKQKEYYKLRQRLTTLRTAWEFLNKAPRIKLNNESDFDNSERQTLNPEWLALGNMWANFTYNESRSNTQEGKMRMQDEKAKIMSQMSNKHGGIVASTLDGRLAGQQYFYFYLTPNNPDAKAVFRASTSGVNNAQDRLKNQISRQGATTIINTHTGELAKHLPDIELIAREVKIHLMPETKDQPMVVDRLLTLCQKYPDLRDKIDAIKVRIENNNQPDELPEIVVYTNRDNSEKLLELISNEFTDIIGTGRIPRYNNEVSNRLVYVAQSGGDLKNDLANMGILDKLFDRKSNHSKLRVPMV